VRDAVANPRDFDVSAEVIRREHFFMSGYNDATPHGCRARRQIRRGDFELRLMRELFNDEPFSVHYAYRD
jgi:hypothetical protein